MIPPSDPAAAVARTIGTDTWAITFLGVGGYGCAPARGMPSTLFTIGSTRVMIDVGDGTYARLSQYDVARTIDLILCTQVTGERLAGLVAVLDTASLQDNDGRRPAVVGPLGIKQAIYSLGTLMQVGARPLDITEVTAELVIPVESSNMRVIPLHRPAGAAAIAYRFEEPHRIGRFNVEAAVAKGLQPGPDFKRLQLGEVVDGVRPEEVIGPARRGRRLGIAGPSRDEEALRRLAANADVLLVPAHLTDERLEQSVTAGYTTGIEAAAIAKRAKANLLVLTHTSAHVPPRYAEAEAAQVHRTVVPRPGDTLSIPLPESGSPRLQRASVPKR